jgi:hypothetical protein
MSVVRRRTAARLVDEPLCGAASTWDELSAFCTIAIH